MREASPEALEPLLPPPLADDGGSGGRALQASMVDAHESMSAPSTQPPM